MTADEIRAEGALCDDDERCERCGGWLDDDGWCVEDCAASDEGLDDVCPDCDGDGTTWDGLGDCGTCGGLGVVPW